MPCRRWRRCRCRPSKWPSSTARTWTPPPGSAWRSGWRTTWRSPTWPGWWSATAPTRWKKPPGCCTACWRRPNRWCWWRRCGRPPRWRPMARKTCWMPWRWRPRPARAACWWCWPGGCTRPMRCAKCIPTGPMRWIQVMLARSAWWKKAGCGASASGPPARRWACRCWPVMPPTGPGWRSSPAMPAPGAMACGPCARPGCRA